MSPLPLPGQIPLLHEGAVIGETIGTATFSDCGRYRYHLSRHLAGDKPPVLFIMLNPSTADEYKNDRTIARCTGYANALHASSLHILNLFAYRTPYPKALWAFDGDRVGPENDTHMRTTFRAARRDGWTVICGWGADRLARDRADDVCKMAELDEGLPLYALHVTKDNEPGHPLYLLGSLRPKRYLR